MTTCRISFVLLFFCLIAGFCDCDEGVLVSVVGIFRHGDRTPVKPYPNDPYKNRSFWPVDFGQLTNLGKEQEYQLGLWLRQRYNDFLPADYSELDIRVRSTDVDRTLMSGEACLAGLYPPTGDQIWDQNLMWQPIPIHTQPETEDAVLAMRKPCPKYDWLKKQLLKSQEFLEIDEKLHDLYAYLTKYSGTLIANLENLEYLYNTLFIESVYNFTLPDWTKPIFPEKMEPWAALSFAVDCYTTSMARLKTGPLFYEIQQHFVNFTKNPAATNPKFLLYSAHDMTIASVLKTIGAFENHSPPYSSLVLFELRRKTNDYYYLNVYYKNTSEPRKMTVEGCAFDCPLEKYVELLKPVALPLERWEGECRLGLMSAVMPFSEAGNVILLSCAGLFMVLVLGLVVVVVRRSRSQEDAYVRLPDTDAEA